ncbi:MAG TPA: hypothetical protein VGI82_04260 [Chitinophagaceae bacterium]|jgi:hypothetical protein
MKDNVNIPSGDDHIDQRLWEYIDGLGSAEERSAIEKLLETNSQWKEKYAEAIELHQLVQSSTLDEPSLRFTKNVMEEIAKYHIAPATRTYINNKIIWGIGIFLVTLIIGFLVYGFGQMDWAAKGDSNLPIDIGKVNYNKFFSNTYVNVFIMINIVLGLMLLDRFMASRRKKLQNEA